MLSHFCVDLAWIFGLRGTGLKVIFRPVEKMPSLLEYASPGTRTEHYSTTDGTVKSGMNKLKPNNMSQIEETLDSFCCTATIDCWKACSFETMDLTGMAGIQTSPIILTPTHKGVHVSAPSSLDGLSLLHS